MMNLLHTTLLLFRMHLARSFFARRTWLCAALALVPAAIAWTLARFSTRIGAADIAAHLGWLLMLQTLVPLLALVVGSAVITEEIEDRTITYLFARPITRASVLLGRWLAALVLLSLMLAAGSALLVWAASTSHVAHATAIGLAPGDPVGEHGLMGGVAAPLLQAVLLGGAVYSALFAVAAVFFAHPMIVGLAYSFAIEGLLANLPGKNQSLTIQYYLRSWIAGYGEPAWNRVEGFASTQFDTPHGAIATLVIVLVAALALGAWRIERREFVLTS
jgi:ABC-2 type transport system permease protein